jgi:exodeoxyribonuclease VII small subunit
MNTTKRKNDDFETLFKEIEKSVKKIEDESLSVSEGMKLFEQTSEKIKEAQKLLEKMEKRIEEISPSS